MTEAYETAAALAKRINAWDKESIYELRDMLREYLVLDGEGVDVTRLPSAEMPSELDTAYPVWAMDVKGRCLVGEGLDSIEHVDDVLASQRRHGEELAARLARFGA